MARAGSVISLCCNIVALLSALIKPFMPAVADALCAQLKFTPTSIPDAFEVVLPEGHALAGGGVAACGLAPP